MAFTTISFQKPHGSLSAKYMGSSGNMPAVYFRDENNIEIPVLNILSVQAKPDQAVALSLAENITSFLNSKPPRQTMDVTGLRMSWTRLTQGFRIDLQHGQDFRDRSSTLLMFNEACPPDLVGEVSDALCEQQGMKSVLDQFSVRQMPSPAANPGVRPAL